MPKKKYGLPDNLTWDKYANQFKYRRPTDRKSFYLGSDRPAAVKDAKNLNAIFAKPSDNAKRIISGGGGDIKVPHLVSRFRREYIDDPARQLASKTKYEYGLKLAQFEASFKSRQLKTITLFEIADYLDNYPPRSRQQMRGLLSSLYRFAISIGMGVENLPEKTLNPVNKVVRQRLTIEHFHSIKTLAPTWFKNTMDLALKSLQRREDLSLAAFDDYRDGIWKIQQKKTGTLVKIHADETLDRIIRNCRDNVASPLMVHRLPNRIPVKRASKRIHHTQVLPEQLSRIFSELRDQVGINILDGHTPPTFHEIRSLGATIYEDMGIDPQPLLGHKDRKTTEIYLSRYSNRWNEVFL